MVLDTFVAITAGLIIFPACFTYHVDQTSGPSLIFITLPNIFANMSMGRLWGSLFFLFMAFAAMSTVLAVFENIICCGMELTGCSRKKSSLVNLVLIILLSMPCVLGYNLWAWDGFAVFGGAVLDVEDFLVSNLFLPLGSQGAGLDARLPDLCAAAYRSVHLCVWTLRQIPSIRRLLCL